MKRILIYFPYNQRTVEQQSVMEMLLQKGYEVFLLTLAPEDYLHQYVRTLGVQAFASPVKEGNMFSTAWRNSRFLTRFCRTNKIDIIFAHQQLCMLPRILAGPFLKTRTFYFRHNTDEDYQANPFKARLMNRFINFFTKNFVAPSRVVHEYLVHRERVNPLKIRRINYGYNFNQYEKIVPENAAKIREENPCHFLILSIARLVPAKRHTVMFEVVKTLIKEGLNIKLLALGDGFLKDELSQWIKAHGMEQHIVLAGRKSNIFDYLAASDLLLHLSFTEASNSVVKEAGLTGRTVVVCNDVGDFGDYIENGKNGFLVNKTSPAAETVSVLRFLYNNKTPLENTGRNLNETITDIFAIGNVAENYEDLINGKKNE